MERTRRKVRSYDVFAGHAFYTPGIKGMFALLGLLIVGALLGSLIVFLLTLAGWVPGVIAALVILNKNK